MFQRSFGSFWLLGIFEKGKNFMDYSLLGIAFGGEIQIDVDERGQAMVRHGEIFGRFGQFVGNDAQMLLREVLRQRLP